MDMISPVVKSRLDRLDLTTDRPLVVVDVDEVLVSLAAHLEEFVARQDYALRLTGYKLDGALKRPDGSTASDEEFRSLFTQFFETQTVNQRIYPHATRVLNAISAHAQVVILTNVPPYAEAARVENLRGHGLDFPVVVNEGGKGRALDLLSQRAGSPVVFIDDAPGQIASAARHAPDVVRIHHVGDDNLRGLLDPVPEAHHAPTDWLEIEAILLELFAQKPR